MTSPIDTWDDLVRLESRATRELTPGAAGSTVWHLWGAGRPVVLLHGGSGSWTHWARNIDALVDSGHRVCVPDLPGFGDSGALPRGADADAIPEWIEQGLAALIGTAPCDVVAFSFGALVGAFLAETWPARVRQLVLVGAPALTAGTGPTIDLRHWKGMAEPERTAALRHNLRALMLSRDDSVNDLALRLHAENLERDRMRDRRLFRTDVLLRTLPALACEVSGIWGADDAIYADRLNVLCPALANAPRFRYLSLVAQAGHWVQFEQAARFNDALGAVLAGAR